MKTLIVTVLVLLTGCGHTSVDPALQPYLDSFVRAGNITIITPFTMQFGDIYVDGEAGVCVRGQLGNFTITIDRNVWSESSDTVRQLTVWHELGHCVLGLQHDNVLDQNGNPMSIMYYDVVTALTAWQVNPQALTAQLFTPVQ